MKTFRQCWLEYFGSLLCFIGQGIYRLTDITFSMLLYERTKVITRFGWQFIWALFFKTAGYGNNELLKKCSNEGLNFICSNWEDVCSVEFTWKRQHWQHHFLLVKQNPLNILSMPKENGSTFGLSPQIDFITWKCRCNILWLPLLVPKTITSDNPWKNSIVTSVSELIF